MKSTSWPLGFPAMRSNMSAPVRQQFCGTCAVAAQFSLVVRGRGVRRHRYRRSGARRHHVDCRRQSVYAQHSPRVHQQERHRQAGIAHGEAGVADRQGGCAGVHSFRTDAVRDPASAAGRNLDHPNAAVGDAWRLYALVQLLGPVSPRKPRLSQNGNTQPRTCSRIPDSSDGAVNCSGNLG
jgi:hypothetical protein